MKKTSKRNVSKSKNKKRPIKRKTKSTFKSRNRNRLIHFKRLVRSILPKKYKKFSQNNYIYLSLLSFIIFFFFISIFFLNKNAFEILVDDKVVTTIEYSRQSNTKADDITNSVTSSIKNELGTNIKINETITLNKVHENKKNISSYDDAIDTVAKSVTYTVEGFDIIVDGVLITTVTSKEEADKILDEIKNSYVTEDMEVESNEFVEDVTISSHYVEQSSIDEYEVAYDKLTSTNKKEELYVVAEGDTLFSIANKFNTTKKDIVSINEDIPTEDSPIKVGQTIKVNAEFPILTVETKTKTIVTETIPKETLEIEDSLMPEGNKKVTQPGSDGEKQTVIESTYINGVEVETQISEETITKEPVTEVVTVGTK